MRMPRATSLTLILAICGTCLVACGAMTGQTVSESTRHKTGTHGRKCTDMHDFEVKFSIAGYEVRASRVEQGRLVLIKGNGAQGCMSRGRWTRLDSLVVNDARHIALILQALSERRARVGIIDYRGQPQSHGDALPDLPASSRQRFDAHAAVDICIQYFQRGGMPRRAYLKQGAYVLDCVLPNSVDSGYLILISHDLSDGVQVINATRYEYDRISRD
jgi:hypothetical protein